MRIHALFVTGLSTLMFSAAALAADVDWKQVGQALGKEGSMQPGDIYKVGLPRTDLKVTLDGVEIKPALALGSWLAFQQDGTKGAVMGDLVLTEDEINPVMSKLAEGQIAITALHNHLLRSQPTTMYMHVAGDGDPVKLARALHEALSLTKTPMASAAGYQEPAAGAADTIDNQIPKIDQILGRKGKMNGEVYQVSVPRAGTIRMMDMDVPEAMGTAIAINFQATGPGMVATTGDFVLIDTEVNPVLQELRAHGIEVTALHSHMLMEEPRLFFMHFWANDDTYKVAKGLRAALDKIKLQGG